MQLRYDCNQKKQVHFSARLQKLHEDAANHSAGIGMGVVDQLWHQLFTVIFLRVSVN